ncbi:MAG: phosphoribosylglycinamide formyltransferase [Tenuifilum sp.]|nr:phosphoribosylglycinamide formyltransferase [Bacteroidales bacterium]HON71618.1 phosphoribosylglycinamide formyltransferase [Tenuifilum sp.]
MMFYIAIFASGSGSNAENIAKHFLSNPKFKITLIATENPNAFVLERAKRLGIPTFLFTMDELRNGSVLSKLIEQKIDFIVLAGFLKMVPVEMVRHYNNRIVNIHPALLPKYGGKGMYGYRVHKAVIAAGETESGITIHYVNEHYDEGDVIFQASCEVLPTDTPETLAQRVHRLEWEYYPKVIEHLIQGKCG